MHAYLGAHEKTVEDRPYSHEQIKRLLEFSNDRIMVMILLLASSGMRRGALSGLKRKHLRYIQKYGLYQITTYPKAKEKYITFCTPECATAINNYFDYRRRCGETINDESPVIRDAFNRHNLDKVRNPQPVMIDNDWLKFMLGGVVRNSGLERKHENVNGKVSQRTEIMVLSRARLQRNKLEALMRHKSLQRVSDKPDEEELLEEYGN